MQGKVRLIQPRRRKAQRAADGGARIARPRIDPARSVQRQPVHRHRGPLEPQHRPVQRPAVIDPPVIAQLQIGGADQRLFARHRQEHVRSVLKPGAQGQRRLQRHARRAQAQLSLQIDPARVEDQLRQVGLARWQALPRGLKLYVVAEELLIFRHEQGRDVAGNIRHEGARNLTRGIGLRAKLHEPRDALLAIGTDGNLGAELVDHAAAVNRHLGRRAPRNVEKLHRDPVRAFLRQKVKRGIPCRVGIGPFERQRPLFAVDPRHGNIGGPFAPRKLHLALKPDIGGHAHDRFAQNHLVDRKLADIDRDRQVGKRETRRL